MHRGVCVCVCFQCGSGDVLYLLPSVMGLIEASFVKSVVSCLFSLLHSVSVQVQTGGAARAAAPKQGPPGMLIFIFE